MSLKSLLQQKNNFIDSQIERFRSAYSKMQPEIFRELQALFKQGVFNDKIIQEVFINAGFGDLYLSFVDNFGEMVRFSKKLSEELAIGFNVSPEQFQLLDTLSVQIETNFSASLAKYSNDLARAGLQSKLGGMGFQQIVQDMKLSIDDSLRRFETEAYTGISQFDSTMNYQMFQSAGIEKFIYVGPADARTREACQHTLDDPKQQTGWTVEEINASETPFIEVGGYNCRHRWLAWVGDINAPLRKESIDLKKGRLTKGEITINKINEEIKKKSNIKYNKNTFFKETVADWKEVEKVNFKPDFISESGSEYMYKDGGVYRKSDHWNREVSTCSWLLDGLESNKSTIAFSKWNDFIPQSISKEFNNLSDRKWHLGNLFEVTKQLLRGDFTNLDYYIKWRIGNE